MTRCAHCGFVHSPLKPGEVARQTADENRPTQLLLEAFSRGSYAAKAGLRTDNPYADPEMAEAWLKGFEFAA